MSTVLRVNSCHSKHGYNVWNLECCWNIHRKSSQILLSFTGCWSIQRIMPMVHVKLSSHNWCQTKLGRALVRCLIAHSFHMMSSLCLQGASSSVRWIRFHSRPIAGWVLMVVDKYILAKFIQFAEILEESLCEQSVVGEALIDIIVKARFQLEDYWKSKQSLIQKKTKVQKKKNWKVG